MNIFRSPFRGLGGKKKRPELAPGRFIKLNQQPIMKTNLYYLTAISLV
jgi:hypothetical protein